MSVTQQIITIALCGLATVLMRFLPFAVFSGKKQTPKFVLYLGRVLPATLFAMLVVYCLKDVSFLSGSHGIPELVSIAVVAALHLAYNNSLLSIIGGTAVYLLFVNVIF